MRVLLYGGCHAQVLRDYLESAFSDEVACTLIINFELIRAGAPFPFDTLGGYDLVVFSPIENKGGYNTIHLADACQRLKVAAICFPWMEWHGYCPGATEGPFMGRLQWCYPSLVERAATFAGSFADFCEEVVATFPDDDTIDRVVSVSTMHLRAAERRWNMTFSLADAISANLRVSRLFIVSDHPSRFCYLELLQSILAQAGFDQSTVLARLERIPPGEPQGHWSLPIFPKVTRRLALSFEAETWCDEDRVPDRTLNLRDYLSLYYHPEGAEPALPARSGEA